MATAALFDAEATHVTRRFGEFRIFVTRGGVNPAVPEDIIVLTRGDVRRTAVPCRIASACVTSTALDSAECECDLQLHAALSEIDRIGCGVVIYLTDQEGRGHGLQVKVRALANKNRGMDTFAAVEALGAPADLRSYPAVRPILEELGVESIVLLSSSPDKHRALLAAGVKIDRIDPIRVAPHSHARPSLQAKRIRGHIVVGQYANDESLTYP